MNIYDQAILATSACNLSGLAHSLSEELIPEIRKEVTGSRAIAEHPVVKLVLYQMFMLAFGREPFIVSDQWHDAYEKCKAKSALEQIGEKQ